MSYPAAIYARVSSDRQKENHTIASQTVALKEYAQAHDYLVSPEWVFEDEGYSGATLVRPGLEALRDLAAQGEIQAVLVYSPDRLSRKYAYQVLLAEELQRCGVSVVFLQAPAGETAEDRLLAQFQGMIAEYERAQILERSRRGKRHKAQGGAVSVLSGAPYGYRYIKKSDTAEAYYKVIEAEAEVVRLVFDLYTRTGLSINAIARHLNQQQIATRHGDTRWERSTVWALLRNPAYQGKACYGKTELRPRQRITHPLRGRNRLPARNSANHERPRQDWIEIPVPALVNEETFALAQEQLEKIAITRPAARSNQPCCKACWSVGIAAMLYTAPRPELRRANSIIIDALAPTLIGTCAAPCVPIDLYARTISMGSCGASSSGCWKNQRWCRPRSTVAWPRHEVPTHCVVMSRICANSRCGYKIASNGC